tara:strand:+ start:134 stop:1219 length:1086 start_codon:yes stop_codon:yes gene_type:complete
VTEKKKTIFLTFTSVIISLLFIELFFQFKNSLKEKTINFTSEPAYLLFQQGKVFKNIENVVKYHSNKTIKAEAYIYTENKFKQAYSYEIKTNNFGLVQKNNLKKNIPSILFLGDSFTEGQGVPAWIDKFEGNFSKYQIINGGILATGPQQFELMEKHVSRNYDVKKVLFLFIGHDIRRSPFLMSKKDLDCLNDYKKCIGSQTFLGYPISNKNPDIFLKSLRNQRIENYKNLSFAKKLKKKTKNFFSNLYIIKTPKTFLREKFYKSKNIKIKKNFLSIKRLHEKYGKNIFFINLKTRNEILNGREYESIYAESFIKNLTNNFYSCEFDNDLSNFNPLDHHPNKKGYDNLFNCINGIMAEMID